MWTDRRRLAHAGGRRPRTRGWRVPPALALALTLALPLTAQEPRQSGAAPADGERRLVLVVFERRVGPFFQQHPQSYGDSLHAWRGRVLDLLFDSRTPLLRPGDAVALFADGAPGEFPRRTRLGANDGNIAVLRALGPMLAFPGSAEEAPGAWVHTAAPAGTREAVDEAIRSRVTCPLAGLSPSCHDERGRGPSVETRSFSRALLTLPLQYEVARRVLVERGDTPPAEVYWVWVQVGERVNETNSLAAEIVRDFYPAAAAEAVTRFRESAARTFDLSPEPRDLLGAPRRGGGVTLWRLRSSELHDLTRPTAAFPVRFETATGGGWVMLEPQAGVSGSLWSRAGRLLEPGVLQLRLVPPAGPERTHLAKAYGTARCDLAREGAAAGLPLRFKVAPDGQSARLTTGDSAALQALASRCRPANWLWNRLVRELFGHAEKVALTVYAQALVGAPDQPHALKVPPLLASASLERSWTHERLGPAARVLHILGVLLAATVGFLTVVGLRYWRSPTRFDLRLVRHDGEPVTTKRPLELLPEGGAIPWLTLLPLAGKGRPRHIRMRLTVSGQGMQADVPVAPGHEPGSIVELRTRPADGDEVEAGMLVYAGRLGAGSPARPAGYVLPMVRSEALDLDRIPPDIALRAGMEITVEATPESPDTEGGTLAFYVPCTITVGRTAALVPELRIEVLQRYLYRGLRPSDRVHDETVVGAIRIVHRADPATFSRPYPVTLELRASASLVRRNRAAAVRAGLRVGSAAAREVVGVERLDTSHLDLPFHLWTSGLAELAEGEVADVHLEVTGSWRELRDDGRGQSGSLGPCRASLRWYPVRSLYGVALDFGTSATRMALLSEEAHADDVVNFELPVKILDPGPDPRRALERATGRAGEIESEAVIDHHGALRAMGELAQLEKRAPDDRVLDSLKSSLTRRDPDEPDEKVEPVWRAAGQLVAILGELVEGPRRGEGPLRLCRWAEGQWRPQALPVSPSFRYLLLVTIPDTFSTEEQARFTACFASWEGRVQLVPLREAEAVVYGALRGGERRPERTLVVDVGAGTVDYAAVRTVFGRTGLTEIRVEGLAVTEEAGNAFDRAIESFLEVTDYDTRTLREIKQKRFCDPEATGSWTDEIRRFLASSHAAKYFERAISEPLQALMGRLSVQEAWRDAQFDQVILTGRGSLGAGWKRALVAGIVEASLAPADGSEDWLRWMDAGSLERRADRLKGAVVEGALALMRYDQARIQTSRDLLRDHVLLLGHISPGEYDAHTLWRAGPRPTGAGRAQRPPVGNWVEARLIFSSHLPGMDVRSGPGASRRVDARFLWEQSLRAPSERGGRAVEVRRAAKIDLDARPPGSPGIEVLVQEGGTIEWWWTEPE